MRKFKTYLALLLVAVMVSGLLTGCGTEETSNTQSGAESDKPAQVYKISIGNIMPEDYYISRAYTDFKKYVEEESEGRIQVDTFFNSVLTNGDRSTMEMVSQGTMTMGQCDLGFLGTFVDDYRIEASTIPYYFMPDGDTRKWMYFMDNSTIYEELFAAVEKEHNIKVVGTLDGGNMSIMYKGEPLTTDLSPLKGLKIRSAEKTNDMGAVQAVGGNATPLGIGEVYTSLQQGVVDGVMTGAPLLLSYSFNDVCNQFGNFAFWPLVYPVLINADFYNSLPSDLQKIVDEGFKILIKNGRDYGEEHMTKIFDIMESGGCHVNMVEGPVLEETKAALAPLIKEERAAMDAKDPNYLKSLDEELKKLNAEYDAQKK